MSWPTLHRKGFSSPCRTSVQLPMVTLRQLAVSVAIEVTGLATTHQPLHVSYRLRNRTETVCPLTASLVEMSPAAFIYSGHKQVIDLLSTFRVSEWSSSSLHLAFVISNSAQISLANQLDLLPLTYYVFNFNLVFITWLCLNTINTIVFTQLQTVI